MAQEALNSSNNINIANTISLWFNKDWAVDTQTVGSPGSNAWVEFGDLFIDGVSINPDFAEHRSYRNGRNSLRKRLLVVQNCAVSATLNEPNITNLHRVLYGGTINESDTVTVYEGRHLELKGTEDEDQFFDLRTDAGERDLDGEGDDYQVTGIYAASDATESTNLLSRNVDVNTDGKAHIAGSAETDVALAVGTTFYVKYQYSKSGLKSTEIYGANESTIEGEAKLQARNVKGGTVQIWEFASAQLSPNGDLGYPLDGIQQVPILLTLQERSGTWGKIYTA